MTKKTTKKTADKKTVLNNLLKIFIPIVLLAGAITIININLPQSEDAKIKVEIEYNPATVVTGDEGEYEEEIPTVEEIDGGGMFQDTIEESFDEDNENLYYELGAIEQVDTSSVEAFKNSTLGRCIIASNYYGAQCVSLSRAFWWSYAGYDVSTCGTGLAKGMMTCADENAKDKFKVIWDTKDIIAGTWIVLDGSRTGHICMALGKVNNGYVSCLGENQGGVPCDYGVGGAGTNIINLSVKNFIGGYIPLDYIPVEPEPQAPDTGIIK